MTQITIDLDDQSATALKALADTAGQTAEEYLARHVETLVAAETIGDEEFERLSNYFLEKNAELYRRLA
jgi:predicted transcriptional regulator